MEALLPREGGVELAAEVAWGLLLRVAGPVSSQSLEGELHDADPTLPVGPCPHTRRVRAFLATAPAWPDWLHYLSTRPLGRDFAGYRAERARYARTWLPHIHPDHALLLSWNDGTMLDEDLLAGIARHVSGPWNCLACRRVVNPPARLAAASGPPAGEWRTHVPVCGSERSFVLRCVDDEGWLRVFLQVDADDAPPLETAFRLTVLFSDGTRLEKRIRPASQTPSGTNLGRMGDGGLDALVGFAVEADGFPRERSEPA